MGRKTVYNRIFNEEEWAKVNPENKKLLREWKNYLMSTDKSQGTIKQYENDMRIIFLFLLNNCDNKFIGDLNKRDIISFQGYSINAWSHSSNRTRRIKSCLSSLCNFIENIMDDLYPDFRNIVNKIESPQKKPVREKTVLTNDQVELVLKTLVESHQYQKACVFALAANSGARLNELLRFKVSFFTEENLHNNAYYKTPVKIRIKGRGRDGGSKHKFILKNGFKEYFDLWMKERDELGITCDELFVTRRNGEWQPATDTTLQSWKTQFSKTLDTDFYFHSMRHYLTTKLRANNIPDKIIKDFFGWESIDMIEIYDDNEAEDDFAKFFTSDGIKKVENKSLNDL
ncbi:site-specific integrase [Cytobacillus kochii]|uniref:tyrosine-type recombinase/integrase n=1 Tax=Cytobacillus kochii TaxID=859143 RepID=UPI001CD1D37C|nr:site-specific integrase [Cytobacillus kochii]MCA1025665.1 site-specific integrase [Cytobacillus kochii]